MSDEVKNDDQSQDVSEEELEQEEKEVQQEHEDSQDEQAEEVEEEEPSCEEKLSQMNDKYLRLNAEFDNFKKRMEKEKYQAISYAHESFSSDLLPVVDALEQALTVKDEQSSENIESMKQGITLTLEKLFKIFEKHGIETIELDGEFDPNLHNAVMQIEDEEYVSGQIVQTLQKGYKIKDRVLRPAMVQVAK